MTTNLLISIMVAIIVGVALIPFIVGEGHRGLFDWVYLAASIAVSGLCIWWVSKKSK